LVKVLIADKLPSEVYAPLLEQAGIEFSDDIPSSDLEARIAEFDGLVVRSATQVNADLIAKAPNLRVIGRAGTGCDNVDVGAASAREIIVENTPDANSYSAAGLTMAFIYALSRKISAADASMKHGSWDRNRFTGTELRGKKLGLIGLGNVGKIVAELARGNGMEVVFHDPNVTDGVARELGVARVELDELLRTSDYVSPHVPLTEQTKGMIGEKEIELMKPTAFLLNVARGEIVNENALYNAIAAGKIAGAGIDVFTEEPYKGRLRELGGKVILTPHLGASTAEAQTRVTGDITRQLIAFFNEGRIINAVNYTPLDSRLQDYTKTLQRIGKFLAPYVSEGLERLTVTYSAQQIPDDLRIRGISRPILTEILLGKLESVNAMNAGEKAQSLGIRINEAISADKSAYGNLFRVEIGYREKGESKKLAVQVSSLTFDNPLLVSMDGYEPGFDLRGNVLVFEYRERPGVVASLTSKVAQLGINIETIKALQHKSGQTALTLMRLAEPVSQEVFYSMSEGIGAIRAHQYNFNS